MVANVEHRPTANGQRASAAPFDDSCFPDRHKHVLCKIPRAGVPTKVLGETTGEREADELDRLSVPKRGTAQPPP